MRLILVFFLLGSASLISGCKLISGEREIPPANSSGSSTLPSLIGPPAPAPTPVDVAPPPPIQKMQAERQGPTLDRTYIAAMLSEIFSSPTYNYVNLQQDLETWVINQPGIFGRGCNPYSTRTGKDCGATVTDANLPMYFSSSTIRQLHKSKICEIILSVGSDTCMKAAAEKIGGLSGSALRPLTDPLLTSLHGLFFRHREMSTQELTIYRQFVIDLAARGKTTSEQWRAVTLLLCEDTGWDVL